MTDHRQAIEELEQKIFNLKVLRDAQEPESRYFVHFQGQITELTGEMIGWQTAGPRLDQLNTTISFAETRLRAAKRDADPNLNDSWKVASGLGMFGLVFLLVAVTWRPSFVVALLTAAFLGAAVLVVVLATRRRQAAAIAVEEAQAEVDDLRLQRDRIMPGWVDRTTPAEVVPEAILDLEDAD